MVAAHVAAIVLNFEHGPFHSQAFWAEEKEAAQEFVAMCNPRGGLVSWLLPKIRLDRTENADFEAADVFDDSREAAWL